MSRAHNFRGNRRGATLIEYAVLAGLIALAFSTVIMVAGQKTARIDDPRLQNAPVEQLPADVR